MSVLLNSRRIPPVYEHQSDTFVNKMNDLTEHTSPLASAYIKGELATIKRIYDKNTPIFRYTHIHCEGFTVKFGILNPRRKKAGT